MAASVAREQAVKAALETNRGRGGDENEPQNYDMDKVDRISRVSRVTHDTGGGPKRGIGATHGATTDPDLS